MNPKKFYTKNILFLFILILFSQNCVEHIFQINVSPMGNFLIQYQGTGDMEDLTNSDFPVPNNQDWEIISNFEESKKKIFGDARERFCFISAVYFVLYLSSYLQVFLVF